MSPLLKTSRYFAPKFKIFLAQSSSLENLLLKSSISTTNHGVSRGGEEPNQLGPPPIRVGFTDSAGRGVFSTRGIGAGELIHTDNPVVLHPSLGKNDAVCYLCLKRLNPRNRSEHDHGEKIQHFCSEKCKEQSKVFYEVEMRADWSAFHKYCRTQGLKYPLLVKRLACMIISGAASANCIDVLQPAQILPEIEEEHSLLRNAFEAANTTKESLNFLSSQWYANVLAVLIHFESKWLYEDLLSSALASVAAEAGVGNAVYILSYFYNHDCDPNVHILWVDSVHARLKALRDIQEGEELRICYIDASMDFNARQDVLLKGFGFECSCSRCLSGD